LSRYVGKEGVSASFPEKNRGNSRYAWNERFLFLFPGPWSSIQIPVIPEPTRVVFLYLGVAGEAARYIREDRLFFASLEGIPRDND
jgi:hypothetical protein